MEQNNSIENKKQLKEILKQDNISSNGNLKVETNQIHKQEIPLVFEEDLRKDNDLENLLNKIDSEEDKAKPLKLEHNRSNNYNKK